MDFKINLKNDIKLVLTQEMQLSINILQLSGFELQKFLEKEATVNPAIEIVYNTPPKIKKNDSDNTLTIEDNLVDEPTLTDFLEEQISYLKIKQSIRNICIFIINNLDHRGYLAISKKEIMNILGVNHKEIDEAFTHIYSLDPCGIGAEDLSHCLKIQLQKKGIKDKNIFLIIDNYLNELAEKKFDVISEKLHISQDQVINYLTEIQTLSPLPSRGYKTTSNIDYIIPDINIEIVDGKLVFSINKDLLPKVYINSNYSPSTDAEKYYLDKAVNIAKSIEKRFETLTRITSSLINIQKNFFFKGKNYLNSLTLKEVANELELHESTISRAIKDKFINSPQGIISMRSLFVLDASVNEIKNKIETIILNEDKKKPLSDMAICNHLKEIGFNIARRTVTKYREELGLMSSRERKK